MVVLATYQHCDKALVHAKKESLEQEIRTQQAEGESVKVFQSDTDGIWFDAISKTKDGKLRTNQYTAKYYADHIQHINKLLSSPPKKRIHATTVNTSITSPSEAPLNTPRQSVPDQPNPVNPQPTFQPALHFNQRLTNVEDQLKSQLIWNSKIDHKITSLENITVNTDMKIDTILMKLEL
jgi:hypothetical protein